MSFFFFSFYFSLWPAIWIMLMLALLVSDVCPHGHHHHHQSFPHVAGVGVPQLLPPHQHSPAPAVAAVPGMTALAAADPGQQLLGAGQLHHQQQLAIASLAAAAGGVATKKRQRDSSEELLLVQTKHWPTKSPLTLIIPIHLKPLSCSLSSFSSSYFISSSCFWSS